MHAKFPKSTNENGQRELTLKKNWSS